jgi:transcriptional regulator with XRE-family HTH domain
MHMAKRVLRRFRGEKRHRRTFIREWRQSRGLTLEQLADRIGITHASLSRIERGLQPYSQPQLEAIADALQTEPASLLMRNPVDPEGIWSVWDQAKPGERRQIVEIAKTLIKTGT